MTQAHILETAKTIALEAGELIKHGFESDKSIDLKSSTIDLVTNYDRAAEALIRQRLNSAFPDHLIVGEEEGADEGESPHVWYVDPIDGTTNFTHGVPFFCVSIAMYTNNKPAVGVIYDPIQQELFYGSAGDGAFVQSSSGTIKQLQTTNTATLNQALLGTGFPYDRATSDLDNLEQISRIVKQCRGLRRLGSAALDLAYVAAGRLDGYWEFKLNMYDVGAGILLVQEAGGVVCNIDGGTPFTPADVVHLVASGPELKDVLLNQL